MTIARIDITPEAELFLAELKSKYGELMFHQSGGCCDGSQPMCFEKGEFIIGSNDVCLGILSGCEFWMARDQFEYWQYSHLTIHITKGRGSSFSLEIPLGVRFIIQSRLFTEEELPKLEPIRTIDER